MPYPCQGDWRLKMVNYLNLPSLLLTSLLIRTLIFGASIGDAIALIALSALYGYHYYLQSKKQVPVNKEILDRIVQIEESLKDTKSKVGALAIASSQFRVR